MRKYGIFLSLLFLLSIGFGCENSSTKKATPTKLPDVDSSVVKSDANAKAEVSDEEAERFADEWVQAIVEKDTSTAGSLIGWREILTRATSSFNIGTKQKQQLVDGALRATPQLVGEISNGLDKGGDYRSIRVSRRGGDSFALFRLVDPELGFNYHLMRLKNVRGRVRADQFFVAMTGEEMSDTFRNLLEPAVKSMGIAGRLTGAREQVEKDMDLQKKMKTAVEAGRFKQALRIYKGMSEKLQKTKIPMLLRISATDIEDEKAYGKAIDDFLELFPDDSAVGIVTLDAGVMRNDPDLLIQGYEALSRWTGGDPYLDLMVAANLSEMGLKDKAKEIADSVDAESVGLADAHDYVMTIAINAEDHAETLKQLRILRDDYGYQFLDLQGVEGYEAFVKSPEFKQWQND